MNFGQYPLARVLLGWVKPVSTDHTLQVDYERADRAAGTVIEGPVLRRLWLDLYRGLFLREEIHYAADRPPVTRAMSNYAPVGPLFFPQRVEIAQGDVRIMLTYQSYDLKRVLNLAQFESGIPEDQLLRLIINGPSI